MFVFQSPEHGNGTEFGFKANTTERYLYVKHLNDVG